MMLFDEIVRSEMGPATESEPGYLFLNRSARPEATKIRQMVEDWFAHYPDAEKADLYARFRSEVDAQHRAACFELALHELFRRLGYEIALHPGLSTTQKTSDFLLSLYAEDRFYLEATIAVGVSNQEAAAQARMNTVYAALNRRVDSPNFFLWLEIRGAPSTQPPAKKLASFIRANLEDLDPDMVTELYESGNEGPSPRGILNMRAGQLPSAPFPKSLRQGENREFGRLECALTALNGPTIGWH